VPAARAIRNLEVVSGILTLMHKTKHEGHAVFISNGGVFEMERHVLLGHRRLPDRHEHGNGRDPRQG
jgi:hypothetical protein